MTNFVYLSNVCEKLAKGVLLYADSNNVLFCEPEFVNAVTSEYLKEFFFLGAFIVSGDTITKAISFSKTSGSAYASIATSDSKVYYSKEYSSESSEVATDKEVEDMTNEVFGN